ncbi:MAG: triose-phosphate isomerase [bacterium]|jgi:triosephosphate isomerase
MRKQIAAANWKMNKTIQEGKQLLNDIISADIQPDQHQEVIFAIPYPFLISLNEIIKGRSNVYVAAQNCHHKSSGAFTGEVSVDMLSSIDINHCIVGHSERRELFNETNAMLAEKVDLCLSKGITPIFCCGEPLSIREQNTQNQYVESQLHESLFHLKKEDIQRVVIAYEPIWAIGTGRTASAEQAQEMHAHLRDVIAKKYGSDVADNISILYGGSVKGANAAELFGQSDVDGGLVGGASLVASEFVQIIKALK